MEQTINLKFAEAVVDALKTINSKIENSQDWINVKIDNNFNLVFTSNNEYVDPSLISISNNGEKIVARPEIGETGKMVIEFRFPINLYKDELIHFIDMLAYYHFIGDETEQAVLRSTIKEHFNETTF